MRLLDDQGGKIWDGFGVAMAADVFSHTLVLLSRGFRSAPIRLMLCAEMQSTLDELLLLTSVHRFYQTSSDATSIADACNAFELRIMALEIRLSRMQHQTHPENDNLVQ